MIRFWHDLYQRVPSLAWSVCAALTVSAACVARSADHDPRRADSPVAMSAEPGDSTFQLDLHTPSVRQPVATVRVGNVGDRFVRLRVLAITNPTRLAISFDVRYRSEAGKETQLGIVSPFPADNPGTFIVPTRSVVTAGGALVLTLVCPDTAAARDAIRVRVAPLEFADR